MSKKQSDKDTNILWKLTPDSLVDFVEKNKNEFYDDLKKNRSLVIKTVKNGLKKGTINF